MVDRADRDDDDRSDETGSASVGRQTTRAANPLTASPDVRLGTRLDDRYELIRLLGRGGQAHVFEARDVRLGRSVAVKLIPNPGAPLPPARVERLLREARAAASLRHPNVVTLYDAGIDRSGLYLVFEHIPGETLETLLANGPLAPERAIELASQLVSGLRAAHEKGLTHRDVKPGNILIEEDGTARLADFGLARLAGERRLTQSGEVVGTLSYMSPEQLRGEEVGPPSDLFAIGCVVHEMVSGTHPFRGQTREETIARILRAEPPPLPEQVTRQAPALAQLVEHLLQPKPGDRPATALEVGDALRSIGRPRSEAKSPRRLARILGPGLAVPLVLAMAAWFLLSLRPERGSMRIQLLHPENRAHIEERAQRAIGQPLELIAADDTHEVRAEASQVANARAAVQVIDALYDHEFANESSVFRDGRVSSRRISLSLRGLPLARFFALFANAARWPVILDRSVVEEATAESVSVRVTKPAPWDLIARDILERHDLRAVRYGELWLIASPPRADVLTAREPPSVAWLQPRTVDAENIATALAGATSPRGIVMVDRDAAAVVVADRPEAFDGLATVWEALEGNRPRELTTVRRSYEGAAISLDLSEARPAEVYDYFGQILGKTLLAPEIPEVNVVVHAVPVSNVLEVLFLSNGLLLRDDGEVLRAIPETRKPKQVVMTVRLERLDPVFFEPLARYLTDTGSLTTEPSTSTIIVRDEPGRASWLCNLARDLDGRNTGGTARE